MADDQRAGRDFVAEWRNRANNDEWRMETGDLINLVDDMADEIERLREALKASSAELLKFGHMTSALTARRAVNG